MATSFLGYARTTLDAPLAVCARSLVKLLVPQSILRYNAYHGGRPCWGASRGNQQVRVSNLASMYKRRSPPGSNRLAGFCVCAERPEHPLIAAGRMLG